MQQSEVDEGVLTKGISGSRITVRRVCIVETSSEGAGRGVARMLRCPALLRGTLAYYTPALGRAHDARGGASMGASSKGATQATLERCTWGYYGPSAVLYSRSEVP